MALFSCFLNKWPCIFFFLALHFYFALGLTNYVATLAYRIYIP